MGEGNLDAQLVEPLLDAAIHLPADPPLLDGRGLDAGLDHDGGIGELIHPHHLQWGQNDRSIGFLLHHFVGQLLDHRRDVVGVLLVGHPDVEDIVGIFLGHVGQGVDGAVGKDVNGAVQASQHGGPQVDLFHQPPGAVDDGHVVDPDLVLEQHEEPRDHVPHQVLGTEAHGQSGHAGAGQQRPHVEAGFLQGHHEDHHPDQHHHRLAENAPQRGRPFFQLDVRFVPARLHDLDQPHPHPGHIAMDHARGDPGHQKQAGNLEAYTRIASRVLANLGPIDQKSTSSVPVWRWKLLPEPPPSGTRQNGSAPRTASGSGTPDAGAEQPAG